MENPETISATVDGVQPVMWIQSMGHTAEWQLARSPAATQYAKPFQMVAKRGLDIILTVALLLLFAAPMAVIALTIKLESRGPVIFRQERTGRDGRKFHMYKFRSMVANAEALRGTLWSPHLTDAPLFKIPDDPRRTKVGKMIRRFSLDELPQLFNVLRGHISLVGPRPALPNELNHYDGYHAQRLLAVPGMTGLWQVNGRSLLSFEEMVELDLEYARQWSIWLDLMILIKTVPVILGGKGAY